MSKPIRWKWLEGHEWQSTVPILRDQDGNDIACPMPGSIGWSGSYMATMAAAPLMMEAVELLLAACAAGNLSLEELIAPEAIVVIREAADTKLAIKTLREDESNDA